MEILRKKLLIRLVSKLYSRDCIKAVGSFKDKVADLLKKYYQEF